MPIKVAIGLFETVCIVVAGSFPPNLEIVHKNAPLNNRHFRHNPFSCGGCFLREKKN